MTYDLFIGDRSFSSWSLRGWLMLEKFGLPHRIHMVGLYSGTMAADQAALLAEVAKGPDRVVIIEDTRELQCAAPNLVAMRTKDGIATLDAPCRRAPSTYRLSFHIYLYSYE